MVTLETLSIIDLDLESDKAENSRSERGDLPSSKAMKIKLKSQQTEREVQSPGQIKENIPEQIEENIPRLIENIPGQIEGNIPGKLKFSTSTELPIPRKSNSMKAENTEQKKIYENCMKILRLLAFILGVRIRYDWKAQRHFLFFLTCFITLFTTFSVLYTIYVHYINGSYIRALEPLAVSGLVVSCALKMYGFLRHWQQILALMFSIRTYFRPNVCGRQAEIVKSNLRKIWSFLILFVIVAVSSLAFYAVSPIMVYLTTSEVIPLVSLEIVFCDQSRSSGFVAATIIHFIMGSYAAMCSADLIAADFQELDEMWNGMNDKSVAYKHEFLKNICKKRQDMNNFLKTVKYVFETKLFIYFCSNYFSQIICLYDITQNKWIGGYGMAIGLFVEMMFYCYIGTQVSVVDDRLCYSIYISNWYTYDLESQRMVRMLLHEAQQSKELQLGAFGPLNLVTGIMILKNIFKYYTVMTELF